MSKVLYLFNPENDMALANNTPYYMTPREIVRMANDLSVLPSWYAGTDAYIKVEDKLKCRQFYEMCKMTGILPDCKFTVEWQNMDIFPWGWNPALIHRLISEGVNEDFYPSEERMKRIRNLSGRQMTKVVLNCFAGMDRVCGKAFEVFDIATLENLIEKYKDIVVKAPWSGSGRGLVKLHNGILDNGVKGWILRVLRTQGFFMVEPLYDKVCDFAMEFFSASDSKVVFCGYSMFETDQKGNYKCNVLASDASLEHCLEKYVDHSLLFSIQNILAKELSQLIGGVYNGYLGVDMMICRKDGKLCIHPCVEINMRMNMGVVSRILFDRYLVPSASGYYIVEHFFKDGEAVAFYNKMISKHPIVLHSSHLLKGYWPLTPVDHDTRFHIYILV